MKQNCWEFKKCGRETGGNKNAELGICPAASDVRLDKTNSGKNGGRSCWVIAGTLCGGKVQGIFAQKQKNCMLCEFYKIVHQEEKASGTFVTSFDLLQKLQLKDSYIPILNNSL